MIPPPPSTLTLSWDIKNSWWNHALYWIFLTNFREREEGGGVGGGGGEEVYILNLGFGHWDFGSVGKKKGGFGRTEARSAAGALACGFQEMDSSIIGPKLLFFFFLKTT